MSSLDEAERRLNQLRAQAALQGAAAEAPAHAASPSGRAWAAPRAGDSPSRAAGLDPSDPDFLARLAELKAQHARNLRELERQLARASVRSPRGGTSASLSTAVASASRPRSASSGRARGGDLFGGADGALAQEAVRDNAHLAERARELDELLAGVRPRRVVNTSRLDAAYRRLRERPRSAPSQRPRARATVPEPFSFEGRDEARRRTRDQQRRARLSAEREEEEEILVRPFKAAPVPPSTVENRYERMVAEQRARRAQVAVERKQVLERDLKPFSFDSRPPVPRRRPRVKSADELAREHKFKAKPVPAAVSQRVYEQLQRDEAMRKERVSRAAHELLAQASLPPRMELHEKVGKVNRVSKQGELSGGGAAGEELFKPKINPLSPAIPAFDQMQKRFEHALAKKKRSVGKTDPQPFSMYTDRRPNRMDRVLRDIERDALVLPEQRWPHASSRAPARFEPVDLGPPPDSAYRTTLAAELRRASLEDEQELRRAIDDQKRAEDEERIEKQRRINAEVAAVLKPTFVSRDAHIQKRRKDKLADEREKRQNWERVKKEIEANVRKRPHLFEQASTSVHVDRARQERLEQFEQTLRDNGLGELIDG